MLVRGFRSRVVRKATSGFRSSTGEEYHPGLTKKKPARNMQAGFMSVDV
jgi:hypothetical protein